MSGLPIVFADDHLIVADKPSGLLSVPGRGPDKADCAIRRAQALFPDALTVHRLDMETSGLIVFGRGAAMQRALSMLFEARQVEKRYEAVVAGLLGCDEGRIDLPLIADWPNRPRQKVDHQIGKPSLTGYRVIARDAAADRTRVALIPHTGRSHQLRVHLAELGHPILGDALYAHPAARAGVPRLLLHATRLAFDHPASGRALRFASAAPF